jgi:hypothetical protein
MENSNNYSRTVILGEKNVEIDKKEAEADDRFIDQYFQIDFFLESESQGTAFLRNAGNCGTGKTTATIDAIVRDVEIHKDDNRPHQWFIAIPRHRQVEGQDQIEDLLRRAYSHIIFSHIRGKDAFCVNKDQLYHQKCQLCQNYSNCGYFSQQWDGEIVIIPIELLKNTLFQSNRQQNLWFDESPERIWIKQIPVDDGSILTLNNRMVIENYCGKDTSYLFYTDVKLNHQFRINSPKDYFLWLFFRQYTNIEAHEYNGRYTLIGRKSQMIPTFFHKVVFTCATTPVDMEKLMFGSIPDLSRQQIGITFPLQNPNLAIGRGWSKT